MPHDRIREYRTYFYGASHESPWEWSAILEPDPPIADSAGDGCHSYPAVAESIIAVTPGSLAAGSPG